MTEYLLSLNDEDIETLLAATCLAQTTSQPLIERFIRLSQKVMDMKNQIDANNQQKEHTS